MEFVDRTKNICYIFTFLPLNNELGRRSDSLSIICPPSSHALRKLSSMEYFIAHFDFQLLVSSVWQVLTICVINIWVNFFLSSCFNTGISHLTSCGFSYAYLEIVDGAIISFDSGIVFFLSLSLFSFVLFIICFTVGTLLSIGTLP